MVLDVLVMELNRKTTGIIIIAAASIIGLVLICFTFLKTSKPEESAVRNVYIEHPDAEVPELEESKLEAYNTNRAKRSSVEDYWDSIEADLEQEDPMSEISGNVGADTKGTQGTQRSLNDLIARTEKTQNEYYSPSTSGGGSTGKATPSVSVSTQPERRKTSEERMTEYMTMRQQMTDYMIEQYSGSVQGQQTQQPAPQEQAQPAVDQESQSEPESVPVSAEPAQVRRSGSISSLDEDVFGTITGGGISSLDDDSDAWDDGAQRPIKCMFVRDEKLESGQRVSIRLLEDMVINGTLIPRNTHLMATCNVGQRLNLKVSSFEMNGKIYSLNFEAYDNDGAKGIYCPDIDDSARQTAKQGGVSIGRRSLTKAGAIVGELANMGVTIAESVGNANKRSVRVPSGYTFYLMEGKI